MYEDVHDIRQRLCLMCEDIEMVNDNICAGLSSENKTGVFRMWYRRSFQIPREWKALADDTRVILHFGAVDWESHVWVNGQHMGMHRGGCAAFLSCSSHL